MDLLPTPKKCGNKLTAKTREVRKKFQGHNSLHVGAIKLSEQLCGMSFIFSVFFSKLEHEDQQKRSKYSRHSLLLCSTLFLCFQRKRFGWRVKTKSQQKLVCEAEIGNRFTFIIRKLTTLLPLPLRMFECFLPTFANCSRD